MGNLWDKKYQANGWLTLGSIFSRSYHCQMLLLFHIYGGILLLKWSVHELRFSSSIYRSLDPILARFYHRKWCKGTYLLGGELVLVPSYRGLQSYTVATQFGQQIASLTYLLTMSKWKFVDNWWFHWLPIFITALKRLVWPLG